MQRWTCNVVAIVVISIIVLGCGENGSSRGDAQGAPTAGQRADEQGIENSTIRELSTPPEPSKHPPVKAYDLGSYEHYSDEYLRQHPQADQPAENQPN